MPKTKKGKHTRKTESARESSYELKVTLRGVSPPIWRRLRVPGDLRLNELHDVLQVVMGWTDSHLHQFTIDGIRYGVVDPDGLYPVEDERRVRLRTVAREKTHFSYEYDFGDSWEHEIHVEKVLPTDNAEPSPFCIVGERACPPEDCGGTWGYEELLQAIRDPEDERHDELIEWLGGPFDPESFDIDDVNAHFVKASKRVRRRRVPGP